MGTPIPKVSTEMAVINCTSSVTTRKMTPEEIKKYIGGNEEVKQALNFTKEELLALCRIHGTSIAAAGEIYKALGKRAKDAKQIINCIYNWKIKQLLEEEKKPVQETNQNPPEQKPINLQVEKTANTELDIEESPSESKAAPVVNSNVQASALMIKQFVFDQFIIDICRKDKIVVFVDEGTCNEVAISFNQLGALAEIALGLKDLIKKEGLDL